MDQAIVCVRAGKGAVTFVLIFIFLIIPNLTYAGLFGPKDTRECVIELNKKLRYQPALSTLLDACAIAYLENPPSHLSSYRKAGKCLLSKTSEIFSAESARSTVNQCTRGANDVYQFYSLSLENSIRAYSSSQPSQTLPLDCILRGERLHCM